MLQRYKHVIWDWNGTLFCDVELGIQIMNGLLEARQLPLLSIPSYREVFTMPVRDYYSRLGFDFVKDPFEVVGKLWMDQYELRKCECGLYPGAREVLDEIRRLGIDQSILSAYPQHTLEELVRRYDLQDYFSHVTGLDNIYAASKVHLGRALIQKLGLARQEAVVIGDTGHDYEVAEAMGADCILIANGHQSRRRLEALGVPVLEDVRELLGLRTKDQGPGT